MLTAYPRPAFARKQWENLNGTWRFAFDDQNQGLKEQWQVNFPQGREILVPYAYESPKSGIGEQAFHPVVWYQRALHIQPFTGRMLLHFEGVDHRADIYINGVFAGSHVGAYAAFCLDITGHIRPGTNSLCLRVEDSFSCLLPRGKQRWKPESFGCWYVQTTGIWKSVWLENVPEVYLDHVKITPDIDQAAFHCLARIRGLAPGQSASLACKASFKGQQVAALELQCKGEYATFSIFVADREDLWGVKLWHPDHPHLYQLDFALGAGERLDQVRAHAGLRQVEIRNGQVLLNRLPLYQRLILDQGYWPDGHLTPPDDDAYERDLDLILQAGFNGLRKHQKTEDRRFLHLCDQKGILVWSEMAAQYTFSDEGMELFTREWMEILAQNHNHPSLITWTPFNESWGIGEVATHKAQQHFTQAIYHLTRAFDPNRPVITNDGWEHTVSDILTLHDYEEKGSSFEARYQDLEGLLANKSPHNHFKYAMAQGFSYQGQPVIISEYGGIAFVDEKGWGYGHQVQDEAAFLKRYEDITTAIQRHPQIVGFCYTQLSDVQQEVNGLVSADRRPKVDFARLREINMRRK